MNAKVKGEDEYSIEKPRKLKFSENPKVEVRQIRKGKSPN